MDYLYNNNRNNRNNNKYVIMKLFKKKKEGFTGRELINEMPRGMRLNFINAIGSKRKLRKIKKTRFRYKATIISLSFIWERSEKGHSYWADVFKEVYRNNKF